MEKEVAKHRTKKWLASTIYYRACQNNKSSERVLDTAGTEQPMQIINIHTHTRVVLLSWSNKRSSELPTACLLVIDCMQRFTTTLSTVHFPTSALRLGWNKIPGWRKKERDSERESMYTSRPRAVFIGQSVRQDSPKDMSGSEFLGGGSRSCPL